MIQKAWTNTDKLNLIIKCCCFTRDVNDTISVACFKSDSVGPLRKRAYFNQNTLQTDPDIRR